MDELFKPETQELLDAAARAIARSRELVNEHRLLMAERERNRRAKLRSQPWRD